MSTASTLETLTAQEILNELTAQEILNELIARMEHTNGLYFCSVTSILQAREMITAHLAAV